MRRQSDKELEGYDVEAQQRALQSTFKLFRGVIWGLALGAVACALAGLWMSYGG